jgi:hypothetical protein
VCQWKAIEVGQRVPEPSGVNVSYDDRDAQAQEVLNQLDLFVGMAEVRQQLFSLSALESWNLGHIQDH